MWIKIVYMCTTCYSWHAALIASYSVLTSAFCHCLNLLCKRYTCNNMYSHDVTHYEEYGMPVIVGFTYHPTYSLEADFTGPIMLYNSTCA